MYGSENLFQMLRKFCVEAGQECRGESKIFLRRGAPLRNDVTDGEVKKNLKAST